MIDFNSKTGPTNNTSPVDTKTTPSAQAAAAASRASHAPTDNNLSPLLTLLKQLPDGKTLEAQVKSSQILSNSEKSLLQQVNPSLLSKLQQQLTKAADTSNTGNNPKTNNNGIATNSSQAHTLQQRIQNTHLFLAKLSVTQTNGQTQLITTVTPQALKANESVLIGQRNQQLVIDRSPTQKIQQAASETIKQILPKQQSIQALQQLIQQLSQLPKPLQTLLLTKSSSSAIQQLSQFIYTNKQLHTGAAVKHSLLNSGVQLEAKLNQHQSIQHDLRTVLSNIAINANKNISHSNLNTANTNVSTNINEAMLLNNVELQGPNIKTNLLPKEIDKIIVNLLSNLSNNTASSPPIPQNLNPQTATAALMRLLGVPISLESQTLAALPKAIEQHLRHLIEKTQARIQLNQLRSLGLDKAVTETRSNLFQQFHAELPLRFNEQILPVQITIQEQEHAEKKDEHNETPSDNPEEQKTTTKQWQILMSFDLPTIDPQKTEALHTRLTIVENSVSATLWTESTSLCNLAIKRMVFLRDKLLANGLNVEELTCLQGRPPQQDFSLGYNLVDIKT